MGALNTTPRWLEREYIERLNCLLFSFTGCDLDQYYRGSVRLWQ